MMTILIVVVSLGIAATAIFGVWAICSISGEADEVAEKLKQRLIINRRKELSFKIVLLNSYLPKLLHHDIVK